MFFVFERGMFTGFLAVIGEDNYSGDELYIISNQLFCQV